MQPDTVQEIAEKINAGQIGVIPTDTIYGIVASTSRPRAIEEIYQIKGRAYNKPFVILISDINDLIRLGVHPNNYQLQELKKLWPSTTSIVLPCTDNNMHYLHRGYKSLAVRLPEPKWLRGLISRTGPIVATSANTSGKGTSMDLKMIQKELPGLDFYYEGKVSDIPSKLIAINEEGKIIELAR